MYKEISNIQLRGSVRGKHKGERKKHRLFSGRKGGSTS